jgi:uncharacterized protein YjeT (DUF2065 family)
MIELLAAAFAVMLVIEGILPFTAPRVWRDVFTKMIAMSDGQIRFAGLSSMMVGLIILFLVN